MPLQAWAWEEGRGEEKQAGVGRGPARQMPPGDLECHPMSPLPAQAGPVGTGSFSRAP